MNPNHHPNDSRGDTNTSSPVMGQKVYDTSTVQRISQAALLRDRLTNGVQPAAVTGLSPISDASPSTFGHDYLRIPRLPKIYDLAEWSVVWT